MALFSTFLSNIDLSLLFHYVFQPWASLICVMRELIGIPIYMGANVIYAKWIFLTLYFCRELSSDIFNQSRLAGTGGLVFSHAYYSTDNYQKKMKQIFGTYYILFRSDCMRRSSSYGRRLSENVSIPSYGGRGSKIAMIFERSQRLLL